ncbi:MAG: radical SAM protein [Desulfobacterales bacterium]|nr:radical SAM protein [Desulfobacterales bacterium]
MTNIKNRRSGKNKQKKLVTALVADRNGEIFELEGYAAVGMAGQHFEILSTANTIIIPHGGELMYLPDRRPVLYNIENNHLEVLDENPYAPGEPVYPVAAFNSPGYVAGYVSAFEERDGAKKLPLFSYGAVGWLGEGFRTSIIQVDKEDRQDLRLMKREDVIKGVQEMRKKMPDNRLRKHLERCALEYGCPAGKNFFLGRYEAPLPSAQQCNARCLGCISLQKSEEITHCQERISFTPTPEEIARIALEHIVRVEKSVVSFGQGCEGDPLFAAEVIGPAIKLIRSETERGTINMNTNGSLPDILNELLDVGLDSIRVSINSLRPECYTAYFRPKGYLFDDVIRSIDIALDKGKYVSINYLNCPGITDAPEEVEAVMTFLKDHPINRIQWRNLNFDPIGYWQVMMAASPSGQPIGVKKLLGLIRKNFPQVSFGYFNPPKENF